MMPSEIDRGKVRDLSSLALALHPVTEQAEEELARPVEEGPLLPVFQENLLGLTQVLLKERLHFGCERASKHHCVDLIRRGKTPPLEICRSDRRPGTVDDGCLRVEDSTGTFVDPYAGPSSRP